MWWAFNSDQFEAAAADYKKRCVEAGINPEHVDSAVQFARALLCSPEAVTHKMRRREPGAAE